MALTDDEVKDLALRTLEKTREMIEREPGEGLSGPAEFFISPDKSVATLLVASWGRHSEGQDRSALMLVVSERKEAVENAAMMFDAWRTAQ